MPVLVSLELAAGHQTALGIGLFVGRRRCFRDKGANQTTRNDCLSRRTSSGRQATTKEACLASVMDSTTVFETVRRGSTPWRGTWLQKRPHLFSECAGIARDFAKVVDQVRFLARALIVEEHQFLKPGTDRCDTTTNTTATTMKTSAFEPMSKRRKGYPSETKVKRGVRIIQGKQLEEKLGRNDLCPCGSGQRFKRCCLRSGRL